MQHAQQAPNLISDFATPELQGQRGCSTPRPTEIIRANPRLVSERPGPRAKITEPIPEMGGHEWNWSIL